MMKTTTKTNKIVISGICIALCVVLPIVFHIIPNAGHGLAYPVDQEGYIKAARDFFSTLE